MKLSELKSIVDRAVSTSHGDDPDVVIQTAAGGIPCARMVSVTGAHRGFDWTAGLFLLRPAEDVVVVKLGRDFEGMARERLQALKAAYAVVNGAGYIPKAREREWRDGFVEGVRTHITACGGEAEE